MKYTEDEIKAMYEYNKYNYYEMIRGISVDMKGTFMDFDEYRKMFKKSLKKAKYLSFLKSLLQMFRLDRPAKIREHRKD